MARLLVLGDPVASLGTETLIPDGGLVIEDATIAAAGPRESMAALDETPIEPAYTYNPAAPPAAPGSPPPPP